MLVHQPRKDHCIRSCSREEVSSLAATLEAADLDASLFLLRPPIDIQFVFFPSAPSHTGPLSSSLLRPGCAAGGPRGKGDEILYSYQLLRSSQPAASDSLAVQLTSTARLDLLRALNMDSWNMSFEAPHIWWTSLSLCSSESVTVTEEEG